MLPTHTVPPEFATPAAPERGLLETSRRLAHRYLLVLRFALANVLAAALLGAVWLDGWLDAALVGQLRWLSLGIAAVFVYGFGLCAARIWRTSRALNAIRSGARPGETRESRALERFEANAGEEAGTAAALLRMRMLNDIAIVRHVAESLVFLGLVGTVVGFIFALSGVDPAQAASVDNVAQMVSTLIQGMSIALYTTLIGAVLHIWLMVDYRMLSTGTLRLYSEIVTARLGYVGE